jgi:hypothetical protein
MRNDQVLALEVLALALVRTSAFFGWSDTNKYHLRLLRSERLLQKLLAK